MTPLSRALLGAAALAVAFLSIAAGLVMGFAQDGIGSPGHQCFYLLQRPLSPPSGWNGESIRASFSVVPFGVDCRWSDGVHERDRFFSAGAGAYTLVGFGAVLIVATLVAAGASLRPPDPTRRDRSP